MAVMDVDDCIAEFHQGPYLKLSLTIAMHLPQNPTATLHSFHFPVSPVSVSKKPQLRWVIQSSGGLSIGFAQ